MGPSDPTFTGGCMCGAVRFEAYGAVRDVGYCHCESCRRHTGAPLVAYVGVAADQVRFSGAPRARYRSSPAVERAFCPECGTSLTWEGVTQTSGVKVIEFHISTLDHPERFKPEEHTRYDERISWLEVADDLPRHRSVSNDP
ncbi:MAG: GFA family protein [Pseudomonadota bacterium]